MSLLLEDLRYAGRMLVKKPGFTLVALLTLALAIGANTAIFSVVNGVLLRPLAFREPERLQQLVRAFPGGDTTSMSVPKYHFLRDQTDSYSGVAAFDNLGSGFNLASDGTPERVVGSRVTHNFFTVFGTAPALGRDFLPEEDRPGAARVVVLSHGLWQRRFGADPGIVGRSVVLNDESYTVIGVAPQSFRYPQTAQLWTPLQLNPASTDKANYLEVVGRLKPGTAAEAARAQLALVTERFRKTFPETLDEKESFASRNLQEYLTGDLKPALLVLLGAVGLVLLIACVNLANLQLARAATRAREIAVRSALGASSGRIVRQLLTESLVLAVMGGLLGVLVAAALVPSLLALAPEELQRFDGVGLDGKVLAFSAGISLLTGVLFGILPATHAVRTDLQVALKEGAQRTSSGPSGVRTRRLLVLGEVALAVVLLIGASLLVKSFAQLRGTAPGFDPQGVLTMKLSLPEARYGSPEALARFHDQVLARVAALPGVSAAGAAASLPLEGGPDMTFTIEGRYKGGVDEGVGGAQYRAVTPGYFPALRIPLVRGRSIAQTDGVGAPGVVLINETAAKKYFKDQDPVGQRIWVGKPVVPELADAAPREIVGVVKDVREGGLEKEVPAVLYIPMAQVAPALNTLLVRLLPQSLVVRSSAGDPARLGPQVSREIWAVDSRQPVTNMLTMEEIVARSLGAQRFNMLLIGTLAALALVLAAVGIYGVLSYLVSLRTQEIGVRVALGATRQSVIRLVLAQGMGAVLAGAALGVAGAFALSRLLASLLYGVSAVDPLAFVASPLLLLLVALGATYLPALRAARVQPMVALKAD
ncbi:ABC transporter permease [Aggregicoccus sp. 17bor-14]|uniref:ABC transporter permease n=1 Tax=Myxococcaceae TaxID=31 RepID=UPI00129C80A1|nr:MULTISPECIES: ABC transporter permease [Myxococcaceae]MBF5044789.1 ABC transporter permease [Simulacricoccus sp. 17bor-14]MRI90533.1 ABC transporter permease [Aggregicoccus sp. 17bor-14]